MNRLHPNMKVTVRIDGVDVPVSRAEMRYSADAYDLTAEGTAVSAQVSAAPIVAIVSNAIGLNVVLRFHSQLLGLSAPDPDEREVAMSASRAAGEKMLTASIERHSCEMQGRAMRVRLEGHLGSGAPFELELSGGPTDIGATVVAGEGRARADALLRDLLGELDVAAGEVTERVDDDTMSLTWSLKPPLSEPEHEEVFRAVPARVAQGSAPELAPTAAQPLLAEGALHAVARAEAWMRAREASVRFELSIFVDEHSGEDGALAPSYFFSTERLPLELAVGDEWYRVDASTSTVEAWLGIDAAELTENVFAFRRITAQEIEIDWSARADDSQPVRFVGRATFTDLRRG